MFDSKNIEYIGESIYNGLSQIKHQNEELLILSIKALNNSLKIIKPLFEKQQFLTIILEILVKSVS